MEEDDFLLKWEKHHNAIVSAFDSLYRKNMLVDCTLAAEEKYIKAHRIILMACSPYLQKILGKHPDNYPVVFFDIKHSELEAIVNFCYRGEVKIPYNELEGFIEAATMLQIKGLCKSESDNVSSENGEKTKRRLSFNSSNKDISGCKKKRISTNNDGAEENQVGSTTDGEMVNVGYTTPNPMAMMGVKADPYDLLNLAREVQGSDNSDVDSDDTGGTSGAEGEDIGSINDFLTSSSTILFPWTCNRCGEAFATRAPYEEHRRNCARADPVTHHWKCHKCPNMYKNKKDLVRHLIYCGNETPRLFCNRCGNSYKYERGLKRHQKYCGTDVKPLKCPQCEKTYKYKRGLRRHQRRCGIAEALQFLAGKGVTPVVVTKRSLSMHSLTDLARSGLPMITATSQLSQLEKNILSQDSTNSGSSDGQTAFDPAGLVAEASVCHCGKVYKYKKSYDKHIASCACGSQQTDGSDKSGKKDKSQLVGSVKDVGGRNSPTYDKDNHKKGRNENDEDGDDEEEEEEEGGDDEDEEEEQMVRKILAESSDREEEDEEDEEAENISRQMSKIIGEREDDGGSDGGDDDDGQLVRSEVRTKEGEDDEEEQEEPTSESAEVSPTVSSSTGMTMTASGSVDSTAELTTRVVPGSSHQEEHHEEVPRQHDHHDNGPNN